MERQRDALEQLERAVRILRVADSTEAGRGLFEAQRQEMQQALGDIKGHLPDGPVA